MTAYWGDVGSNVYTNDLSIVQDKLSFSILPGSPDVYNNVSGAVGHAWRGSVELRSE